MYRYIALLRGINVGGHKKLPMAELRTLLESLGFSEVQSYIQSGNVVFSSEREVSSEVISNAIEAKYGWHVPVLLITGSVIKKILKDCPFPQEEKEKSYFALLFKPPSTEDLEITRSYNFPDEEFYITTKCIYLYCSAGYGRAKTGGNFFEKNLRVTITSRNYRTMIKLLEMAG